MMGFEGREDYTAVGAVTEIVSRLCREAKAGEILLDMRTQSRLHADSGAKPRGSIMFKDIDKSIDAYKISQYHFFHAAKFRSLSASIYF